MKSKLFMLLGVLVVLSMALSACQPAAPAETIVETVIVEKEGETIIITATPAPVEETETVSQNPYLGSNMLDGNGTPPTFFDDVHIRKAFSYCFDWETVVDELYMGEAVQSKVLSLPGMPGYDRSDSIISSWDN